MISEPLSIIMKDRFLMAEYDKEYYDWLMAHIALQSEGMKSDTKEARWYMQGHIALLEHKLKEVRRELRGKKKSSE